MADKLETYIQQNLQDFDAVNPTEDLWQGIEAKLDIKTAKQVNGNWFSKSNYLFLGVCILAAAIVFVTVALVSSSSSGTGKTKNSSTADSTSQEPETIQNRAQPDSNAPLKGRNTFSDKGRSDSMPGPVKKETLPIVGDSLHQDAKDSMISARLTEPGPYEHKENKSIIAGNKAGSRQPVLYRPVEALEMNTYTGTLYDGAVLCDVLKLYKFPGKVSGDKGNWDKKNNDNNSTIRTLNCSLADDEANTKIVWLKGKTSKGITLAVKKGFKNIVLIKKDGRRLNPEAISHYYPGRGIISGYKGNGLSMVFKDDVELILLFKDAAEGDRILIDEVFEAIVKVQP